MALPGNFHIKPGILWVDEPKISPKFSKNRLAKKPGFMSYFFLIFL